MIDRIWPKSDQWPLTRTNRGAFPMVAAICTGLVTADTDRTAHGDDGAEALAVDEVDTDADEA